MSRTCPAMLLSIARILLYPSLRLSLVRLYVSCQSFIRFLFPLYP